MGEDGKGSLEPGVASGDVFVMAYPTPFCEYYWYANRAELDDEKRKMLFPDAEQGGASTGVAADGAALAEGGAKEAVVKKEEQSKPPIFDHLTLAGSHRARSTSPARSAAPTPTSTLAMSWCQVAYAAAMSLCTPAAMAKLRLRATRGLISRG